MSGPWEDYAPSAKQQQGQDGKPWEDFPPQKTRPLAPPPPPMQAKPPQPPQPQLAPAQPQPPRGQSLLGQFMPWAQPVAQRGAMGDGATPAAYSQPPEPEAERGFGTRAYDFFTGNTPQEYPAASSFTGSDQDSFLGGVAFDAGLSLVPTEEQQADIIVKNYRSQFPNISWQRDRYGNIYINTGDGQIKYVNKPGFDREDVQQGVGQAFAFLGAGKLAGAATGLLSRMGVGAAAAAGTSVAQDVGATLAGSKQKIDPWRALAAAGGGAAAEAIAPAIASAYRWIVPRPQYFDPVAGRLTPAGQDLLRSQGLDPGDITDELARSFAQQAETSTQPLTPLARTANASSLPVPVPLTRGQAMNDPDQWLWESQANKGVYGQQAQQILSGQAEDANAAITGNVDAIRARIAGGPPRVDQVGQGGQIASDALNAAHDAQRRQVASAYDAATDVGYSAGIDGLEATNGAQRVITAVTRRVALENAPKTANVLNRFRPQSTNSSVPASEIFQIRRELSELYVEGGVEAVASQRAVRALDAWIDDALSNALIQGDATAIQAFRDAIAANRSFASTFKGTDLVGKLTARDTKTGQMALSIAPESAANAIFGQSALGAVGRVNMLRDLMKMRNILGRNSEGWNALREEAFVRLWSKAQGAVNSSGGREISAANFTKALDDLRTKSTDVYRLLFDDNERRLIEQFGRVMSYVKVAPPGGVNTSNSSGAIVQAVQKFIAAPFMGPRAFAILQSTGILKNMGEVMQGARAAASVRPLPAGPRAGITSALSGVIGQGVRDDVLRAQQNDPRSFTGGMVTAYNEGDTLDKMAMLSSPIPVVGDVAGVANDIRNFRSGKTPMTWANVGLAAAGALPFVPGVVRLAGKGAAKVGKGVAAPPAAPLYVPPPSARTRIDPARANDTRPKLDDIHEAAISSRLPGVSSPEYSASQTNHLVPSISAMARDPEAFKQNIATLSLTPGFRHLRGMSPTRAAEEAANQMADNLLSIKERMSPEYWAATENWYPRGADFVVKDMMSSFGLNRQQAAALIANLSPATLWDLNVEQAKRMANFFINNRGSRMTDTYEQIARGQWEKAGGQTGPAIKNMERVRELRQSGLSLDDLLKSGRTLDAALLMQIMDRDLGVKPYPAIMPWGEYGDAYPRKYSSNSTPLMGSALKSLMDPTRATISKYLGPGAHKIRSFYNTILNPHSSWDEMVSDTHSVGASTLIPYSNKSDVVGRNFGDTQFGVTSSAKTGSSGTYGVYADAHRIAADRLGKGNAAWQIQSPTWSGIRDVFDRAMKKPENVEAVKALWTLVDRKQMTHAEARNEFWKLVLEGADKIPDPPWLRPKK